jgi:hypothetical protein
MHNYARRGELHRFAHAILGEAYYIFDLNNEYIFVKCTQHLQKADYMFRSMVMSATIAIDPFHKYFKD